MKDQYFGDLNDYFKVALLRELMGSDPAEGRRLGVCWMRTPADGRGDGRLTGYLQDPERWRGLDPELYDALREAVCRDGRREIRVAAEAGLLPGALFYDPVLPDEAVGRAAYFEGFWAMARGCELLFFDPDNGMEVASRPYGCKGSSKYLYWREFERAAGAGHSLLIYQHFPRAARGPYVERLAAEMLGRSGRGALWAFRTARVLFALLPAGGRAGWYRARAEGLGKAWGERVVVSRHGAGRE